MVETRVADGVRIAELLASEVEGRTDGPLGALCVTDANPDVEPTTDGARAYAISRTGVADEAPVATATVLKDRLRLVIPTAPDAAHEAATAAGLRSRPKATTPPQTLVFVESGADVKRATDVLAAATRRNGE